MGKPKLFYIWGKNVEKNSRNLLHSVPDRGALLILTFIFKLLEGKKDEHDSGPEEEEVPTRGFLKRQANMIVDAKSRSKRGTRRR